MYPLSEITICTTNKGKVLEFQNILGKCPKLQEPLFKNKIKFISLSETGVSDFEVEETGKTYLENARLKAIAGAKLVNGFALADDSGIEVFALNQAPGIYSGRYLRDPQKGIAGLLAEMSGKEDRRVRYVCALVLANADGDIVFETEAYWYGELAYEKHGEQGFGFDPVVYPDLNISTAHERTDSRTVAELSPEEKDSHSHRFKAVSELINYLSASFKDEGNTEIEVHEHAHIAVMPKEVLNYLNIKPDKVYFDCTLGAAGHSQLILSKLSNKGRLYSFDQDKKVIEKHKVLEAKVNAKAKSEKWILVNDNFVSVKDFCIENKIKITGGILLDLGISSIQLDDPERGFSYLYDSELDMRMNQEATLSAYDVINTFKETELANIFYNYAEERLSRQIAERIINERPINSCSELASLVKDVYWRRYHKHSKAHPATKVFQALRIYVNKELEVLETLLESLPDVLEDGATVVIISFHSLEDRIVKQFLKKSTDKYKFELCFKKPLCASEEELKENSRSRSAKLRAARFILKE